MAELIFLGTGPSSGIPSLRCRLEGACKTCLTTTRTNVSVIIHKNDTSVLIDCGKHFYTQFNRYLSAHGRLRVPELVLTHPHADAIAGIDTYLMMCTHKRSVYSSPQTLEYLQTNYAYYFRRPFEKGHRAYLQPRPLLHRQIEQIGEVKVQAFDVEHGVGSSLAFLIEDRLLYISDTSSLVPVPDEFFDRDVLVIDCLTLDANVRGHLNLKDVKEYARILRPKKVVLTGLSHQIEQQDAIDGFVLAYDGMSMSF